MLIHYKSQFVDKLSLRKVFLEINPYDEKISEGFFYIKHPFKGQCFAIKKENANFVRKK